MMDNQDDWEGKEDQMHSHMHHMYGMPGPMKREFKLAMLEKKEKILKAELEFVSKMKEIIEKMPKEPKE